MEKNKYKKIKNYLLKKLIGKRLLWRKFHYLITINYFKSGLPLNKITKTNYTLSKYLIKKFLMIKIMERNCLNIGLMKFFFGLYKKKKN